MNILWDALKYAIGRGAIYGFAFGALLGTLLWPILGTLYGFVIGGMVGSILAFPCGLVVGGITYRFSKGHLNIISYRWTMGAVCALVAYIGTMACLMGINSTWAVGAYDWASVVGFQIPSLIAAAAAIYATRGFAQHYIEKNERKRSEKPSQLQPYLTI